LTANAATRPVSIGLNDNWELFLSRNANVGWVRIDFSWAVTEPQNNVFNWNELDTHVNEAEQNGLQILAILHYVPSWANNGGNLSVPPFTTTEWADFVKQVAIRYSGRVAAYEIWNEPDTSGNGGGIGWERNVEEPPLYTDFVHTAAQMIRTYSPGSLVVGPAYRTHKDGVNSQADNRKRRFFQQMQAANYADGPGPNFLDVTSYHNNASDTEPSRDMGLTLRTNNLAYLSSYLPSKASSPVWVTEYGWRSNAVTNNGQREKECNLTKIYTGLLESAYTGLGNYNITRAFIYVVKDNSSASIYYGDNTPKPVVTQYLQRFTFPAVQNPANSADFPNCNGSLFLQDPGTRLTAAKATWNVRGLREPANGLPFGFAALDGDTSEDGSSVYLSYKNSAGAVISVSSRPAEPGDEQFVNDGAAEWTRGDTHVAIRQLAGPDAGKGWARALATTVDPDFAKACVQEQLNADDAAVRSLGYATPKAPKGFVTLDNHLDVTRFSAGCGAAQAATPKDLDFVWSFVGARGEILRAGIYRYGDGFKGEVRNAKSLHWSDARGTRYWVALDAKDELTADREEALNALASSLDPTFAREPRTRDARQQ
jgi:hypothetical protein